MKLIQFKGHIVTIVLVVLVLVSSGPDFVHAVDSFIDGHIIFSGPGQNSARDIHTTGNIGGMRFFNATSLSAIPEGAAIQFYGNGHTGFPGQAFIDSGAHDNAAVIFRTAGTGQGITERMRITAGGRVGIGTTNPGAFTPRAALSVNGPIETTSDIQGHAGLGIHSYNGDMLFGTGTSDADSSSSITRMVIDQSGNVSIGGPGPAGSRLYVQNGYFQFLSTSAGSPPLADCDSSAERGRLSIDTTNNRLYICNGAARGWDFVALTDS